jgi:hypothetical protein
MVKNISSQSLNWVELELGLKRPLYPYSPGSSGRTAKVEPSDLDQGRGDTSDGGFTSEGGDIKLCHGSDLDRELLQRNRMEREIENAESRIRGEVRIGSRTVLNATC